MPSQSQYFLTQQSRLKYSQKFPNNGIKCKTCQLIFDVNDIQHHMLTHIYPSYMTPVTKENNVKKIKPTKIFFDDDKENMFINQAINSIKFDQLPKNQHLRSQINIPQQQTSIHTHQHQKRINFNFNQNNLLSTDSHDVQTDLNINNIEYEYFLPQYISENVNLGLENYQFQKYQVQTYQTKTVERQKHSFNQEKTYSKSHAKQFNNQQSQNNEDSQSQNTTAYVIEVQKQRLFDKFMRTGNNDKKHSTQQQVEKVIEIPLQSFKPSGQKYQSISTKKQTQPSEQLQKSQSFSFLKSIFACKDNFTSTNSDQVVVDMQNMNSTNQSFRRTSQQNQKFNNSCSSNWNNQHGQNYKLCRDCGGFYCSTCHSTIPPQYRVYNLGNVDQKSKCYYQNIVYRQKNCNDCN